MSLPLRYNIRNLFRRKLRTALTVLGIGLVIAVAVIMMAYSRGLLYALRNNGDADNVMVLARRATDCTFSAMARADLDVLGGLIDDDVAWHPPLDDVDKTEEIPVELVTPFVQHASLVKIEGVEGGRYGERKLGMIMGVDPDRVHRMHRGFKLVAGRRLNSEDERAAMVGALTWARLGVEKEQLKVGSVIEFNGVEWPVVGIFEVPGTGADGQIWVPIDEVMTILNRQEYSFALIKGEDLAKADHILQVVNRTDQVQLRAVNEVDYYRGFAETFRTFALIGGIMALVITIGGIMVGMNTMYTAVSGRVREIGMLQVLGFSKRSIVASFVLESVLIALAGGVLGCALGSIVNGVPMKVTMGVFLFRVDLMVIAAAMGLALLVGLIGALIPALRAVRLRMVDAMRYV